MFNKQDIDFNIYQIESEELPLTRENYLFLISLKECTEEIGNSYLFNTSYNINKEGFEGFNHFLINLKQNNYKLILITNNNNKNEETKINSENIIGQ